MLELENISARYGAIRALEGVSFTVPAGQVVCLLGANGAGKTTTLNCISGVVPLAAGRIRFEGEDVAGLSIDKLVARGIVQVPEGREIFPELSVADNLLLGQWLHRRKPASDALERVYDYFPRLKERAAQHAGTLSGGEQQMLMIGRALMARPKLLLLDEPSLGLSPVLIEQVFAIVKRIHVDGVPILLVEQNARVALAASQYGYVLENGEIRLHGAASELAENPEIRAAYLGG
ncbi:MAG TPA: ABC transporter ATP-binding protein [Bradyrhizobium sp.]|nr:ABC transporter ATP-binding protein [Bradyrhizobium sp.]